MALVNKQSIQTLLKLVVGKLCSIQALLKLGVGGKLKYYIFRVLKLWKLNLCISYYDSI